MTEIVIIAATGKNGEIGYKDRLPWPKLQKDMKHFRELTKGFPVVMGRKTYESIPYRPLEGRINVILTKNKNYQSSILKLSDSLESLTTSILVFNSLEEMLDEIGDSYSKIFIAGGASIYEQTLDFADMLQITKIDDTFNADTYFPKIKWDEWQLVKVREENEDIKGKIYRLSFETFVRLS